MNVPTWMRRAAAAMMLALLAACAQRAPSSGVIRLGIDLPLSGSDASVGRSTLNGVLLAIDEANRERPLPGGFALQADSFDDTADGVHSPQQGALNMRALVADPNVLAVVGPYNSSVAAAQIPLAQAASLALISPAASGVALTAGSPPQGVPRAFFRVCATNARQGEAAAAFAMKFALRTAVVVDDEEAYGTDVADVFVADYRRRGGTVLGREHLSKDQRDLAGTIAKIAAAKPAMVFYGGTTSTGAGRLREQMIAAGLRGVEFVGGDGIADIANVAGKHADGTYFTVGAPNAERIREARGFLHDYEHAYHQAPGPYSASGFAAAQVAIEAIRRALAASGGQPPSRAAVLAEVAKTDDLQTPVGKISFDANGDVKEPVLSLWTIRDGEPMYLDQVRLGE